VSTEIVHRAQILLPCWAGEVNTAIAKRMELMSMTVGKWLKRYLELGLEWPTDPLSSRRSATSSGFT
jgi:hypothetical protein